MSIRSRKNLYPGINNHLNSYLQNTPRQWQSFHAEHIIDLARSIRAALPPGYFTMSENSLQIESFDANTGSERRIATTPDVLIARRQAPAHPSPAPSDVAAPAQRFALPETVPDDEDVLSGLIIYRVVQGDLRGKPVTRIELLSPSNKPRHAHHEQYAVKRLQTLHSGLRLVEIDYLNQTLPIIPPLAAYPQANASPFVIIISDPRPTFEEGTSDIYPFGVDQPLPTLNIPLEGEDVVQVNFNTPYQQTYAALDYTDLIVDYAVDPVALDKYHLADQTRIREMLEAIREN